MRMNICGSLMLFGGLATMLSIPFSWGLARVPLSAIVIFLPIVVAMAFEVSGDLIRTSQLTEKLGIKEVELRGTEEKLALAADAASAGLWSVERETGRLWATSRAYSMFGLEPEREHEIEEVLVSVHPDDRD